MSICSKSDLMLIKDSEMNSSESKMHSCANRMEESLYFEIIRDNEKGIASSTILFDNLKYLSVIPFNIPKPFGKV